MTRKDLLHQIKRKESYLCIGLDTDIEKIPAHLRSAKDPVFEFNRQVIDATHPYCTAYKPNLAFYESLGSRGLESLQKTMEYIPENIFTIADAKRGDIGNTSSMYAKSFFEEFNFDSVTLSPYMGHDSVLPYLEYKDKWIILLALTSNAGSKDFQTLILKNETGLQEQLFERVITASLHWGSPENMMYVVGATRPDQFTLVRNLAPEHFFLVPGIGSQGGNLEEVSRCMMNKDVGLLVNSSRQVLYASSGKDFAEQAGLQAKAIQAEMSRYMNLYL